ncbi:MAG: 6-phosphofructokinase [Abditibacteriales bacterium]|nr:6-phosphofructokinase [Abditibacteriales bacterium]MDW8364953.1 6-phosphofructokinase [Abditibacteriales bacterium]
MAIQRIAVLTSGGDAPGMNAALRAVVRYAIYHGVEVVGVRRGYAGLIAGDFVQMHLTSVSGILHLGGTILKSSRCEEFKTSEGRQRAIVHLDRGQVDALIVIGGNGTTTGAADLSEMWDKPVMGVPSTIDNDLYGTDYTIGFDTAVNTALEAIDRLRDTAASHDRLLFVEVMGRDAGFIALLTGLAGGAEGILIPEISGDLDGLCETLVAGRRRGKQSSIVVVAEGNETGGAFAVAEQVKKRVGLDYRVCVLGHVQRGGSPTAVDRLRASRYAAWAVQALLDGERGKVAGEVKGEPTLTPLREACSRKKDVDMSLYALARILSS